jgi:hypothetical protein
VSTVPDIEDLRRIAGRKIPRAIFIAAVAKPAFAKRSTSSAPSSK